MPARERILADLDGGLEQVLALIGRSVVDPKSAMRWPVLSTASAKGGGDGRIVVLRQFDRETLRLGVWTDGRSSKVSDLKVDPGASLLFFDAAKKLQIRTSGSVSIHIEGHEHAQALEKALQGNMADYSSIAGPGRVVDAPNAIAESNDAAANFVLLQLSIDVMDVLELSRSGHRRAWFEWTGDMLTASWRVP